MLSFAFTGTLPSFSRHQAMALVTMKGGAVMSHVTRRTDYLVAGEDAGSRLVRAKALGVRVISEDELCDMLCDWEAR